jgi:hypothetical protein
MEKNPRNILLTPPSSYSETEEEKLERLREKDRRKGCEATNGTDGYPRIIKTERCDLPERIMYSLTSHWVPIHVGKQRHFSAIGERARN